MGLRSCSEVIAPEAGKRTWRNAAFVVEALVLLVFIMIGSAILLNLFASSYSHGIEAGQLSSAVLIAENDAEAFAADPKPDDVRTAYVYDDGAVEPIGDAAGARGTEILEVVRTVDEEHREGGTLYTARIAVVHGDETVYELETARYVSKGGTSR